MADLSTCCANPGNAPSTGSVGSFLNIGGVDAYHSGNGDKYIVIATDIFGASFPNVHWIADQYAAAGFNVWVPDLFHGDPFVLEGPSLDFSKVQAWRQKHPVADALVVLKSVINALETQGAKSAQVIGFCYGGKPAVEIGKHPSAIIKSVVLAHPSALQHSEDAQAIQVPLLFLIAEKDQQVPTEALAQWRKIMAERNHPSLFLEHPGTNHGFAVRPNNPIEEEQRKKATEEAISWFNTHA